MALNLRKRPADVQFVTGRHASTPARVATWALLVLALLGLASASSAQDLLVCEDSQGRPFLTHPPCPPGSSYVRRHPSGSSAPVRDPAAAPGKKLPDAAENALDPADTARVARAVRAARFKRALAGLGTLRIYSLSYYNESGEWPTRPKQLGLDPKTLFNEDIARVDFRKDGTIEAHLRPDFGEDKRIWLHPKTVLGGAQIRWNCRTNLSLPKQPGLGAGDCHSTEND